MWPRTAVEFTLLVEKPDRRMIVLSVRTSQRGRVVVMVVVKTATVVIKRAVVADEGRAVLVTDTPATENVRVVEAVRVAVTVVAEALGPCVLGDDDDDADDARNP
jgi:DUF917 family protein